MGYPDCDVMPPLACPFHKLYEELNQLTATMTSSYQTTQENLDLYHNLRNKLDKIEALGGDKLFDGTNGVFRTQAKLPPTLQNLANMFTDSLAYAASEYSYYNKGARITGEAVEQVFFSILNENAVPNDYSAGSHRIGADISIPAFGSDAINYGISIKSGTFNDTTGVNAGSIRFSGSRTTSYATLEDKLKFLNRQDSDAYFLLSRYRKDTQSYKSLFFETSLLDYGTAEDWEVSNTGWKLKVPRGIIRSANIAEKMSGQLWVTIDPQTPNAPLAMSVVRVPE